MRFCEIHLREILQQGHKFIYYIMSLKITLVKWLLHLPRANELIIRKLISSIPYICYLFRIIINDISNVTFIFDRPHCSLGVGDTSQIWAWFKRSDRYFSKIRNISNSNRGIQYTTWVRECLNSSATRMFVQQLVEAHNNENSKTLYYCLWQMTYLRNYHMYSHQSFFAALWSMNLEHVLIYLKTLWWPTSRQKNRHVWCVRNFITTILLLSTAINTSV